MAINEYDHEALTHAFVDKCMKYFIEDLEFDEREELEEDLPEYAISIDHAGGYDLDQRLATLTAERDALRAALEKIAAFKPNVAIGRRMVEIAQEALK